MVNDLWHHFIRKYNKTYGKDEWEKRLDIFRNNYKFIYDHNLKYFNENYSTFYLDINEYTDLSHDEFMERMNTSTVEIENDIQVESIDGIKNRLK